jgi:hypothetical protein|tara:strand:- start:595 stop:705 length:111 start_codon:yes stop_codon:yes gene_type:complete
MYSDLSVTEEGLLVVIVFGLLLYMLTYYIHGNEKEK